MGGVVGTCPGGSAQSDVSTLSDKRWVLERAESRLDMMVYCILAVACRFAAPEHEIVCNQQQGSFN